MQIDIYIFIVSKKYFQRNLISIQYKLQSKMQTIYITFVILCICRVLRIHFKSVNITDTL